MRQGGAHDIPACAPSAEAFVRIPAASLPGEMRAAVLRPAHPSGRFALVLHGRNGAWDQPQMTPAIRACLGRGLPVLAPDLCASSANASPGAAEEFTMSGHLADAGAALDWVEASRETLGWRRDPPLLIGHSMGAYAALRLAA